MTSHWCKFITQPGHIRVVSIEATNLMHELVQLQRLIPQAHQGYGEAIVSALLIASAHKSNESINLNAKGSELYRQAMVDASPEGRVRGFLVVSPESVEPSWGQGVLSILYTKNFEGKSPYTGRVEIRSSNLDEAINDYYRDSEQLVARVGLAIGESSRGVLIQALGGASAEELRAIQQLDQNEIRQLAKLSHDEQSFMTEASRLLDNRPLAEIERTELKSFCTCSEERIERALILTGEEDVLEALGEDVVMTVSCDFCRREYRLARQRVRDLFKPDRSRLQ